MVATKKLLMVKKRSGRLEPFDSRKMARAVSRAGVPYAMALEITRTVKNHESLASKEQVSSITLRKMVAEELIRLNQETAAKSYRGYKKTKSTKEKFVRSRKPKAKLHKTTRTHAKQSVMNKDNTGGRPPRW